MDSKQNSDPPKQMISPAMNKVLQVHYNSAK